MTTTATKLSLTKRITAILMAIILAVTLTPTTPKAYAATDLTAQATTAVAPHVLTADEVTAATLSYTGKKLKPKVTVKVQTGTTTEWVDPDDGSDDLVEKEVPVYTTLKKGRDYTLVIKNKKGKTVKKPKAKGTYKAIVTGKGAYTGAVTKSFKVAKETVYFTTCCKTKKGGNLAYGITYTDTSDTSGVLSLKGHMRVMPRSWVKWEVTNAGYRYANLSHKCFSTYMDKKKKVKAKSFTLTSDTQCYETDGDSFLKGHPVKTHYRIAGKEATLCRDNVKMTRFPLVIVLRDSKVIKLGVCGHKASVSNGYGW